MIVGIVLGDDDQIGMARTSDNLVADFGQDRLIRLPFRRNLSGLGNASIEGFLQTMGTRLGILLCESEEAGDGFQPPGRNDERPWHHVETDQMGLMAYGQINCGWKSAFDMRLALKDSDNGLVGHERSPFPIIDRSALQESP